MGFGGYVLSDLDRGKRSPERRFEALSLLVKGPRTPSQLADMWEVNNVSAYRVLERLRKYHCVKRDGDSDVFECTYSITDKGLGRLQWFEGQEFSFEKYEVLDSKISGRGTFSKMAASKGDDFGLAFTKTGNSGDPDRDFTRTVLGRFTNHSETPNLELLKKKNQFHFIATTRIRPGDELTVNYLKIPWDGELGFEAKPDALPKYKIVTLTAAHCRKWEKEFEFNICADLKRTWDKTDKKIIIDPAADRWIGYSTYDPESKSLSTLEVNKEYKRQGFGKILLDLWPKAEQLYVEAYNTGAIALYKKAGWLDIGDHPMDLDGMKPVRGGHWIRMVRGDAGGTLYHLSTDPNLNGKTLKPRVPDNWMTQNGYEDNTTKRVSFAQTIGGSLRTLPTVQEKGSGEHGPIYVYEPKSYKSLKIMDNKQIQKRVPDAHLTGEVWVMNPVKLERVGTITHLQAGKEDRNLTYEYGDGQTAQLWNFPYVVSWKTGATAEPKEEAMVAGVKLFSKIPRGEVSSLSKAITDPIQKLMDLMKPIQYGWYGLNNRKNHEGNWARPDDPEGHDLWWKTYYVMSPEDVWKHKIGVCFDQSIFEQDWLNKNAPTIKTTLTFIQCYDSSDHMWLTFEENGKLFWFEHSWGSYRGIHGPFKSIKEIAQLVYKRTDGATKGYKYKELGQFKRSWINLTAKKFLKLMDYDHSKEDWEIDMGDEPATLGRLPAGPISLMRLIEVEDLSKITDQVSPQDLSVEKKLDGWQIQTIGPDIYSRRGKKITDKFLPLAKALKDQKGSRMVGELVYWNAKTGKMDESSVTKVAGTKDPMEAALKMAKLETNGLFQIIFFDMLQKNGKDISGYPFEDRRKSLEKAFRANKRITRSPEYPFNKWETAYEDSLEEGGEGVVMKNKLVPYLWEPLGESEPKREGYQWKVKEVRTDDFVVYDHYYTPKGSLIVRFGQYHGKKLVPVGEMNNFSRAREIEIEKRLKKGPFLMEIVFQERFPKPPGKLRNPRFLRFREDLEVKSAKLPSRFR